MIVAKKRKPVTQPEVVLPAYGCPDLVSAAIYAGLKPVLVDFEPDRPWLSIDSLDNQVSANTVAIVGVNFLGISERFTQMKPIAARVDALLIEDSAQSFPGKNESGIWHGDLVVLSFGRGKPVSLLGGGAVLFKDAQYAERLAAVETAQGDRVTVPGYWLKKTLYNSMLNPYLYWLPAGLPFLHLGETRYHPLSGIATMDELKKAVLPDNVDAYQSRCLTARQQIGDMISQIAESGTDTLVDLPAICGTSPERPLLRYPVLVKKRRDVLLSVLTKSGLGASPMYPSVMPLIEGLDQVLDSSLQYPNAAEFSANFMTLPTHAGVRNKDIKMIGDILASEF